MTSKNLEDFMEDACGNLVHKDNIRKIDLERDTLVKEIAAEAEELSGLLAEFRERSLEKIQEFCKKSAEQYKVKTGGIKGNTTLTTFNHSDKVQVTIPDVLVTNENFQTAIELLQQCIAKWSEGSHQELIALINGALQTNNAGALSVSRLLGLNRVKSKDYHWNMAMKAIRDSVDRERGKTYFRVYKRLENGGYMAIPLDVANA